MKQNWKSLDILKGIAIIMIIISHNRHFILHHTERLRMVINFGQMGCSIFFMVSGMALCYSWTKQLKAADIHSLRDAFSCYIQFIRKRYLRLIPGYVLILFLNFILNVLLIDILYTEPGFVMNKDPFGILLHVFFLHGFFPQYINTVFPGGWYIGTSFILYLLFPLLFFVFQKAYHTYRQSIFIFPLLLCFVNYCFMKLLTIVSNYTIYPNNNSFWYFFFTNQLPCFSVGILLYFQEQDSFPQKCPLTLSSACSITTLFLSLFLFIQPDHHLFFTIIPFLVSVAFYWFTVFLLRIEQSTLFFHSSNKATSFLMNCGKASYSLYLVHGFFSWYGIKALTSALNEHHIMYHDMVLYLILLPITIGLTYIFGLTLEAFLSKMDKKLRPHR